MSSRYLIDTNLVVDYIRGYDVPLRRRLRSLGRSLVSVISLGELYLGANRSSRLAQELRYVNEFLRGHDPLPVDDQTAQVYGSIKAELLAKGRAIPENDIWIAAQAVQHNLILATRDRHFTAIAGLAHEIW